MKNTAEEIALFRRALGSGWSSLPAPLKRLHDVHGTTVASGTASIRRGSGPMAQLIASLFGFPESGENVPVSVTFEKNGLGEIWTRKFGEKSFSSRLEPVPAGHAAEAGVIESFAPFSFRLRLNLEHDRLYFSPQAWWVYGLPLPIAIAPHGCSYEFADGNDFAFHIEICVPGVGLIVRYIGVLKPGV